MRKPSETDVVKGCLDLLRLRKVPAFRCNSGAFVLGEGNSRRFFRAGVVGGADILGLLPPSGRFLAVEVKTRTGRLTDAQAAFLDAVRAAGGLAVVVRSVADLDAALTFEGVE